jgi:hypothetical protein
MAKSTNATKREQISREEALIDSWLEEGGPYVVLHDRRGEYNDDAGARHVRTSPPEAQT